MKKIVAICAALLLSVGCASKSKNRYRCSQDESALAVTQKVEEYSSTTVSPRLNDQTAQDVLGQLLLVSKILLDPHDGVAINRMDPSKFMVYNMLSKMKLGFVSTIGLSHPQKQTLRRWHQKYMQDNPADVFFAPSADEIIGTRAAFGCTHYARAFMAVVKALDLVDRPEDLRYVISSKADDYNLALEKQDIHGTINGHQFVIVKINDRWIAINTSKGASVPLPAGFDPEAIVPPHNTPIRFQAYPNVVFLFRKIGTNWDDDCGDDSLSALMNISRSGAPDNSGFLWETFEFEDQDIPSE